MREDIEEMRKNVQEVQKQEESFATQILRDYKKSNKRMFIIILVILSMLFATIGYLVYILNDIGTEETITQEVESNENSTITQSIGD